MTNNQLTDQKLTKIIESAEAVISALAGHNDDVHPDDSTKMCSLWDTLNDNDAPPEVVLAMARELQQSRKLLSGIPQDAIDGGWTAKGLSDYAKRLESGLQERRKAAEPEINLANLANKFYERYPLATFKSDSERAEAFGYFMAGAELQCFGEFIKYEDLCGDE